MIYGGTFRSKKSYTFETLDMESGVWIELKAASMGQPYLTTLIPFGSFEMAREGALLYYDITNDDIHIFSEGKWGKTEAKAPEDAYGEAWSTLVPRSFICG